MKRGLFILGAVLCMAGFGYTLNQIFYGTPLDRLLFFNQKIFYYHVPNAFNLFVAVFVCGGASLMYLIRREERYDDVGVAAGELAVLFGAIVLITGMIWGKVAWNVWWSWDSRLTTSLLLWMLMVAYVLARKYGGPGSERLAAGLGVFSMVGVPLTYFSVKLWRTLHPSTSTVPSLDPSMKSAFWLSVLLFLVFFVLLLVVRVSQVRAQRTVHQSHELGLDAGLFE